MNQICRMKNTVQDYAWGSHTAIADLLGQSKPSHRPQAELWMGAHPKATSHIWFQERWQALDQLIAQYPIETLGAEVVAKFDQTLPFLFKVLAADRPLSIQAHPNPNQALSGFRRENEAGIDLEAPHRNYKDDRHKPECLSALTPFWGLCGFRSIADMMTLMGPIWPGAYTNALTILTRDGLRPFFAHIMTMGPKLREALVGQVIDNTAGMKSQSDVAMWIHQLAEIYHNDIGVLSPILLNVVHLTPGQAIYLPAGQLHAYLDGVGIEIMANSDNVLRGGLTPKHVDVTELLNVLDFTPRIPTILNGSGIDQVEHIYPSQAAEFIMSIIRISEGKTYSPDRQSAVPEIVLCTQGQACIRWHDDQTLMLPKGQSAFIPASVGQYTLSEDAILYRARVNL